MIDRRLANRLSVDMLACMMLSGLMMDAAIAENGTETPRIDSVVMSDPQPHEQDGAVIWFDDFDDAAKQSQYGEKRGELTHEVYFGGGGASLRMRYPKGEKGIGGRKLFFGDSPAYGRKVVRPNETFTDVYWRIYVKHPHNWTGGGPAKLSRATSLVSPNWKQAMIAHVWSSGEALTLDPASGITDGTVVTTKYNDFDNLRWLGNKPTSTFLLHSRHEAGRWVCVESRAKLNTPGAKDGLNQLWIDGHLEAERRDLDWRGIYTDHGINAVFLEAYWNRGSPVEQSRWLDNFVVSTQPIGPVYCPRNPELIKTNYRGPGKQSSWEVEIATDDEDRSIVWKSNELGESNRVQVTTRTGMFQGPCADEDQLNPSSVYFVRVRQQSSTGTWSSWSRWHQPFQTHE